MSYDGLGISTIAGPIVIDVCGSGGKSEGHTPVESANSLISVAVAKVIDVLVEGSIKGLVNGAHSIYLDGTPLLDAENNKNFKGFNWELRRGLPEQDPLGGFNAIEAETVVSVEIRKANPIIRTITETDIDDLLVKLMVPQFFKVEKSDGDMVGTSVNLEISIRTEGGAWSTPRSVILQGKTNTAFEKILIFRNMAANYGAGPWEVKISRLTKNSKTSNLANSVYWESYITRINEQLYWPDIAHVGLEIHSRQFGSRIPDRGYELDGFDLCHIPSNYDPETRVYTGIWDGTFVFEWTRNPAWIFYELITNDDFGLGIPALYVNKWILYEISQYCDELVFTGTLRKYAAAKEYAPGACVYYGKLAYKRIGVGNTTGTAPTDPAWWEETLVGPDAVPAMEPRFLCDLYMQTREEAYHALSALASNFLSMPFWGASFVHLAQDRPEDPTHLVTPANVIDGNLDYQSSGTKARHSVALVSWNDPDDHYKPAVEPYEDDELIARYGWNPLNVLDVGCTRRSQAARKGKWLIETEKYETEVLHFVGGLYFADAVPGCILKVMDPDRAGARFGGRLLAGSVQSRVMLDSAVTLESGKTYVLSVTLPDKTLQSVTILTGAGVQDELDIQTLSAVPLAGAVWIITSPTEAEVRYFRVTANAEAGPLRYAITAVMHDPTKEDRVFFDLALDPKPASNLPTGAIEPPSQLSFDTYTYRSGRNVAMGITMSWPPSTDPRVSWYEIHWRKAADDNWRKLAEVSEPSYQKDAVRPGTYDFRIRCRGMGKSDWEEILDVELLKSFERPPVVTGLQTELGTTVYRGRDLELSWDDVRGLDYFPEYRFKDYRVEAYKLDGTTLLRRAHVTDEKWTYTRAAMVKNGLTTRSFIMRVRARDIDLFLSTDYAEITVEKELGDLSGQSPTISASSAGISVNLAALDFEEENVDKLKVLVDTVTPPVAVGRIVAAGVKGTVFPVDVTTPTTYYVQVVPVDRFGDGTPSNIVSIAAVPKDAILQSSFTAGQNIVLTEDQQTHNITIDATGTLPTGGSIGQLLVKSSSGNFVAEWLPPSDVVSKSDVGLSNVDNVQQLPMSYLDTDPALTADSDSEVPSQKAVKAYVDAHAGGGADIDILEFQMFS